MGTHTHGTASRKSKSWQPVYVFVCVAAGGKQGLEALRRGAEAKQGGTPSRYPPAILHQLRKQVPVSVGAASGSPRLLERLDRGRRAGEGAAQGLAKELDEAVLTVGLVVLLLEGAFVELLEAEGTDEVLRVELLGHGCDAAAGDGLLAARAERAAPLVVVHLAVGLPVMFEEAAIDEWREALLQGKGMVFRLGAPTPTFFLISAETKHPNGALIQTPCADNRHLHSPWQSRSQLRQPRQRAL